RFSSSLAELRGDTANPSPVAGMKRSMLRDRRNISPGTCCQRLRSAEVPSGRGPAGACCRLKGLCRGWDRPERRTEEQSRSIVAMGPQPQVHPSGVRTWVEEHEPEEGPTDAWPMDCRASTLDEGRLQNCLVVWLGRALKVYRRSLIMEVLVQLVENRGDVTEGGGSGDDMDR
uniref:SCAN box domain-containing protein n=1 Tax=Oryzias latipes TaxID=8090 RepID=A0A3P9JZJ0_ORYLA